MDSNKFQRSILVFRLMALLGGLFLVVGLSLWLSGLAITAIFAIALIGGVGLFTGLIGLLTLRVNKLK